MKNIQVLLISLGLFITPFIIGGIFEMFGINRYDSIIFVGIGTILTLITVLIIVWRK